MILDGPIPGQSLTKTPRNALYERPPEIADPNEAVLYHMQRLSDPERLDNLLYTLEYGLPIKHATQAALTVAVGRGIHSIDISFNHCSCYTFFYKDNSRGSRYRLQRRFWG